MTKTLLQIAISISAMMLLADAAMAGDLYSDTIDLSVSHQTIDYIAASDCWSIQKIGGWSPTNRKKIADLLFSRDKGIGLSGWRFNLAGGIENSKITNPGRTGETFWAILLSAQLLFKRCETSTPL